jgi:phosphatidylserine/phosphatidylglycerophosphate/cardiolipin synthase-like enzyme
MKLSDFSIEALRETITGDNGLTPYLSGPNLIKLFGKFGIRDTYTWGSGGGLPESMSRNQYAIDRLKKLNGTKELKALFETIVDSRHLTPEGKDVNTVVAHINEIIKHDGYKLEEIEGLFKIVGEDLPDEIEVEIHFEEIQQQIIDQLKLAKFSIWIAVAWFTDKVLFELLKAKKAEGVNVQIIVIDDDINRNYGLNYESEFETYRVKPSGKYQNIMHHKFCVIDLKMVIHGSYNWTNKARWNKETISIDVSRELAEKFASTFVDLKK